MICAVSYADLLEPLDQLKSTYQTIDKKSDLLIVFDIDDTILSNKFSIKADNGYVLNRQIANQRLSKLTVMNNIKEIYDWSLANNIGVVFITYRCETERLQTNKNLHEQNLDNYMQLILFPEPCDYKSVSAQTYKTHQRMLLVEKGYTIIAAVGDQYSDILGGYAKTEIKLPDPGYYTK